MIQITDKQNCCGCSACAQRCPKQCITMQEDEEGFLYPQVDTATCVDCGLCEKVCPIFATKQSHEPLKVFAATNPDENVRKESSSGGIFSMLAEYVIKEGGIVYGAKWDKEWNVVHDSAHTVDKLSSFRGSKYVQSNMGDTYVQIENILKTGKIVLFSGTPCQVLGLKLFLRKDYSSLYTVACVCHGVPSNRLWKRFLVEYCTSKKKDLSEVSDINFRDKRTGWQNYSSTIRFQDGKEYVKFHDDNIWMRAFIHNLTLRPSCYSCATKILHSQADITLGDFWGCQLIGSDVAETNNGISLVIVHSDKGHSLCHDSGIEFTHDYILEQIFKYNSALAESPIPHPKRTEFVNRINGGDSFMITVKKLTQDPIILRIKIAISKFLRS